MSDKVGFWTILCLSVLFCVKYWPILLSHPNNNYLARSVVNNILVHSLYIDLEIALEWLTEHLWYQ